MNSPAQSNCYNGFDLAKFIMDIFVVTLHAHPFSDFSFNLNYAVTHGVTRMAVPYFFIGAYLSQKASDIPLPRLKRYMVVFFMLFMTEVMGGSFCGWTQLNYSHDVYIMLLPLTYYVFLYTKAVRLPDSPAWGYLRKQSMFIFYIRAWGLFWRGSFLVNQSMLSSIWGRWGYI